MFTNYLMVFTSSIHHLKGFVLGYSLHHNIISCSNPNTVDTWCLAKYLNCFIDSERCILAFINPVLETFCWLAAATKRMPDIALNVA